jgi:LAS superfamily LD-carboxypeptidase LdcB
MIRNSILTAALVLGSCLLTANGELTRFSIEELMGKVNPARHKQFAALAAPYTDGRTHYLRTEATRAFEQMAEKAKADGIQLRAVSATRPFQHQKGIWERKWSALQGSAGEKARNILTYSSMPGTSRHHWGTDLDINSVEPEYFETEQGAREYAWLQANAAQFGFFQPYTKNPDRPGYADEPWHWSYAPLAQRYLFAFNLLVDYSLIEGFDGAEAAAEIKVLEYYVNGIDEPRQ